VRRRRRSRASWALRLTGLLLAMLALGTLPSILGGQQDDREGPPLIALDHAPDPPAQGARAQNAAAIAVALPVATATVARPAAADPAPAEPRSSAPRADRPAATPPSTAEPGPATVTGRAAAAPGRRVAGALRRAAVAAERADEPVAEPAAPIDPAPTAPAPRDGSGTSLLSGGLGVGGAALGLGLGLLWFRRRRRRRDDAAAAAAPRRRRRIPFRNRGAWELWRYLPRAFPYLRPYRRLSGASIGLTVLTAAVELAQPWPFAILIDSVLSDHPPAAFVRSLVPSDDREVLLIVAVIAGFGLTVLGNALGVLNDYVNARIEQRMVLDLRSDLFQHCQRLSLAFHDERQTGEFMSRINLQASSVGTILLAFPPAAQSLLTLTGMFVIAYLIHPMLALLALAVLPFLWYTFGLYGTRIVPRLQRVQSLEWRSLSIVHETMAMLRVIVSFGRERHEHRRFRNQGEEAVEERVKLTVRQTGFTLGVNTLTAAGTALVMGFGAWFTLKGELTLGELIVLLTYIAAVYQPLEAISGTVGMMNEQLVALKGSVDLLDTAPEVVERPGAVAIGRAAGHLTVDDLSFEYRGRRDTLKDVSFHVRAGQRVAVVGPTGAGKTTLMSLIARFYEPKSGCVRIDGVDIRDLTIDSLREQISIVLQEPMLFSGTIAENIRYGRLDADMDDIVAAARGANAHDFISRLPLGYDTVVGEGGAGLSGGERQRVCVARAFIKDAPILMLDEPTSSIDSKTEGVILDALERLMVGRTTLMIAHRLSTIRHADLIVVLDEGRVVEIGRHDELVEREGGLYRLLHEAQTGGRRAFMAPDDAPEPDQIVERLVPIASGGRPPEETG
jgi:ATP-binding cassette subfamily B protein